MLKLVFHFCAILSVIALSVSCRRNSIESSKPKIDAQAAAAQAIEMFDNNGDDTLDDQELKQCPGLAEGKNRADTNGDGRLTKDEITQRIEFWNDSRKLLCAPTFEVSINRLFFPDIEVVLEPEPFLKKWLSEARDKTDSTGRVLLSNTDLPNGLFMGYYRVTASLPAGPRQQLPARYNEKTELGIEITDDRPETDMIIRFPLKSR